MLKKALVLASLGLFACGGDDTTTPPIDASNGKDTSVDQSAQDVVTQPDTSTSDAGSDVTGFDVSIPDASFGCTDPSTCDGGFCCADLVLGVGNPPSCPISSLSSACKGTCTTQLKFTCSTTETVRFCAKNADCSEVANPKCCEFQQGNQKVTFCASNAVAQFATKCL